MSNQHKSYLFFLDNWGKDSLGPFAQKVQLLGKKYFGLAGSRSTQIFRLSDRTLYQDLKQGKHKVNTIIRVTAR